MSASSPLEQALEDYAIRAVATSAELIPALLPRGVAAGTFHALTFSLLDTWWSIPVMRFPSPPVPLVQPDRDFSLVPPDALVTTFVAPLPGRHPQRKPLPLGQDTVDHFSEDFLASRAAVELEFHPRSLDVVAHVLRQWFTLHPDPELLAQTLVPSHLGNVVTLLRVLAVVDAICHPSCHAGDEGLSYSTRFSPRLRVAPGGNFATLVWLGYLYVVGFAERVQSIDAELRSVSSDEDALALVWRFVSITGTAPAHDYVRSADRALSDEQAFRWPGVRLSHHVRSIARRLRRARDAGLNFSRQGARPAPYRLVDVLPDESPLESRRRKFLSYCYAAEDILTHLVDLLSVACHVTALARRLLCPHDPRIGLEYGRPGLPDLATLRAHWARYAAVVRPVRDQLEPDLLDGYFVRSAALVGVAPSVWWCAQRDMVNWVNTFSCEGVMLAWGVLPGEDDSWQYAGPRSRPTHAGFVDPRQLYQNVRLYGGPYPGRSGPRTLAHMHQDCVDARRRSPPIPGPRISTRSWSSSGSRPAHAPSRTRRSTSPTDRRAGHRCSSCRRTRRPEWTCGPTCRPVRRTSRPRS